MNKPHKDQKLCRFLDIIANHTRIRNFADIQTYYWYTCSNMFDGT